MGKVYVFDHPLIQHKMALLRDKNTSTKNFRELVNEIGLLMGFEATRNLKLEEVEIETPICSTKAKMLPSMSITIVPILRAGLGLVDGLLQLIPNAKVGHVGLYREEESHEPHAYYCKMPKDIQDRDVLILDRFCKKAGCEKHYVHVPDRSAGRHRNTAEGSSGCGYIHRGQGRSSQ